MEVLGAFLDSLSLQNLYVCKKLLEQKLKVAKAEHRKTVKSAHIEDYFDSCDTYVTTDDVLFAGVSAEVASLGLKAGVGKTDNKWLSSDGEAYTWSNKQGKETVNPSVELEAFPCVKLLMEKINSDYGVSMNSCLVTYYPDGKSAIKLHQDDEQEMDAGSPICVFSIGAERTVRFHSHYQQAYEPDLLRYTTGSGSLYMMKAGCQSLFRHGVAANKTQCSERYSLSFRNKVPKDVQLSSPEKRFKAKVDGDSPKSLLDNGPIHFVKGKTSFIASSPPAISNSQDPPKPPPKSRKMTTVLFGTSHTTRINPAGIGKRGRKFVNQSRSGAKMDDIKEMMDDFADIHPAANDVEKVILSMGTNDIKYERYGVKGNMAPSYHLKNKARNGIRKFREQIVSTVKLAKRLFPGACIVLQSVLPMRRRYWYTVGNVLGFNDILREVSGKFDCYYLDCFQDFLSADGRDINERLFYDWLHPNKWGSNILSKCFGFVTNNNSNTFNIVIDNNIMFSK